MTDNCIPVFYKTNVEIAKKKKQLYQISLKMDMPPECFHEFLRQQEILELFKL